MGCPEHLHVVRTAAGADAALIASLVHYGTGTTAAIKDYLVDHGVPVRRMW